MIGELQQLLAVRDTRLKALQSHLAAQLALLAEVEAELATIDAELAQIASQRTLWEQQWQHWLREDRVLQHGQDYNLSHVALSAWECDAKQARAEIADRHRTAAAAADAAKHAVMRAQVRLDVLSGMLGDARRLHRARQAALLDSRLQDEQVSRAGALRLAERATLESAT